MQFLRFSHYLQQLEQTPSRNQMTAILAQLLQEADLAEVDRVCYLSLGRMGPLYENLEFGISDKLMLRVIAQAFGKSVEKIKREYRKKGDLGQVAADIGRQRSENRRQILENRKQRAEKRGLTVGQVFEKLYAVAVDAGEGSQKRKIRGLAELIWQLDPVSAKYLVRIPLGKLRLGFSEMTLLDALSWLLVGDKSARRPIETAYVRATDIGKVAYLIKKGGLAGIKRLKVEVGTPIKPALSERLGSSQAVVEKLGRFAVEPKLDGFRVQIHVRRRQKAEGGKQEKTDRSFAPSSQSALFRDFGVNPNVFVRIFSRNLEDTTPMFPEIVRAAQQLPVESAILDGEAIAFDPETKRFLSFQETVQRKRKHGVGRVAKKVPLRAFIFDLLYLDGESLLDESFGRRRRRLEKIFGRPQKQGWKKGGGEEKDVLTLTQQSVVDTAAALDELFELYVAEGLEGVMCKKLESIYQAGGRNYNWVKIKRAAKGAGLADTIDAVVMGYYVGKGARTKLGLGAFLVGVRDEKDGTFRTLAKVGTGLSEDQWQGMYQRLQPLRVAVQPKEYVVHKNLIPDQWVGPGLVVEIKADEITRSPVHSAYADVAEVASGTRAKIKKSTTKSASENSGNIGMGLALRFPRLVSFRSDKSPQDATTVTEVTRLYKMQTTPASHL